MSNLGALCDLADLAVVRSEEALSHESREHLASVARRARRRRGFLGEVLVVAFAGGTGTGKSSLINEIVGEPVAAVGIARPTTTEALAVIPGATMAGFDGLLDELGVGRRVESDLLDSLMLVDLPDFDSTQEANRRIVEDVLPRVDAVVWVADPEKYADAVIHVDFLSAWSQYEGQFIFVLNQVDRLEGEADRVVAHFADLLTRDGFTTPEVVQTIARGPDKDISPLRSALADRLDTKRTVTAKLATDLKIAAQNTWIEAGSSARSGIDDAALRDRISLAAATFVSLGVAAADLLHQMAEE